MHCGHYHGSPRRYVDTIPWDFIGWNSLWSSVLFDALPTLLMDEGLAKTGLLEAHMAGPPPFDPQSVTFQNTVYTDGMRVRANQKMKDPFHSVT